MRKILLGAVVLVFTLVAALAAVLWLAPAPPDRKPALAESPPLRPRRAPRCVAPTAIALRAIRDALDAQAPRDLSGKRENPVGQCCRMPSSAG